MSAATLRPMASGGWERWRIVTAAGFALAAVLAMFDVWSDIALIAWKDEESSQVLLAPMIFAWLVWVRRDALLRATVRSSFIGPALLLIGAGMSFFGYYQQVQAMWHAGAVVVMVAAAVSVLGGRVLMAVLPAVIVLGFMVPVPGQIRQQIAGPLQMYSAQATQAVLQVFGIFAERSGNLIVYNNVDIAVAEACNGMRMIFALILVCYAFAFATPLQPWARVLILIISPLAALAANVVRLVPTTLVYGHFDESVAKPFHDVAGWGMLVVGFVGLMAFVRLLRWADLPVMLEPETPSVPTPSPAAKPKEPQLA